MQAHSFGFWGLTFFVIILARYVLVAGLADWWLVVRSGSSGAAEPNGTRRRRPSAQAIRADIQLSVTSSAVFAGAMAGVVELQGHGLTRVYSRPDQYGFWYLGVSYLLVLILQDLFFYATHRLCHHPALYSWMHRGHHRSGLPTPWTSFAFDPPEAVLQALFLVGVVALVPLHPLILLAVLTTMTLWAVVTHLGVNPLPVGWAPPGLSRWLIGPTHHGLHHRHSDRHFGLYFTFWDRLLATQDPGDNQSERRPAEAAASGPQTTDAPRSGERARESAGDGRSAAVSS